MIDAAADAQPQPRAYLRVGGATLARHQLGIALALECQRVICIARDISPELIALQHATEQAGARLHVIPGSRALAGLVTANDELIALTEGLLAAPHDAIGLLAGGHGVLVQPVEEGLAAGFERIDINHAAAGALRIPGRLVEQLAELPGDVDVPSALTRIALQAGVAMIAVPAAARDGVRWKLVRNEAEANAIEPGWIRLHMGDGASPTPGIVLSRAAILMFGPSLLHAGSSGRLVALSALLTLMMALSAGWLGYAATGLTLCAIAWTVRHAAGLLQRVEHDSLNKPPSIVHGEHIAGWLVDTALILVVVWSASLPPWESFLDRVFAPFMLIAMVRLLPRLLLRGWTAWLEDRALLALLLALAAIVGELALTVTVLAMGLAVAGLLLSPGRPASTRV